MTNMEYYRKDIEALEDTNFAITDNRFACCMGTPCSKCYFDTDTGSGCVSNRFKWLMAEYEEPVVLDRLIEPITETRYSPVDDTSSIIDNDSVTEIVEKLNEVIAYINNRYREEKK